MNAHTIEIENRFIEKIWNLGVKEGVEQTLKSLGLLSEFIRKSEAIKMIGSERLYNKAVELRKIREYKPGCGMNSSILVKRSDINLVIELILNDKL